MKNILPLFLPVLIALSCNNSEKAKEQSSTTNNTSEASVSESSSSVVSFKIDNTTVNTQPLGVTKSKVGNMVLINIVTDRDANTKTLNITINGSSPGKYRFADGFEAMKKEGAGFGSYTPDAMNDALNVYSLIEGSIEISSIDANRGLLNAIFSGTAKNAKGEQVQITEGKIQNAKISMSVNN